MAEAATQTGYVLAAAGREEHEIRRLDLLQEIFDPHTRRRLDLARPGCRCLEVGAGRGSIARFLAERVGPEGEVVAADIDIAPLAALDLPNGRVVRHNILTDPIEALGGPGSFDLIHARFLLQHLYVAQDQAIARMVELLKPGGWLVTEDSDTDTMAAADPEHPLTEPYNQRIAMGVAAMRQSKSVDPACGRGMLPRFKRAGLVNLRHEAFVLMDHGGGPLCSWYLMSTQGTRASTPDGDQAVDLGVKALSDPSFWLAGAAHHCAWGQKPL